MPEPKSLMMMPWFPRDFMSSTRGWSVTAKGVYRELLDAQWDMGELPADPDDMRMVIGATEAEWDHAWPKIESKFPLNCSGRKNLKLESHRQKASEYHDKRSEAGRKGNAKRWQTDRSAIANGSHPSPSPSPSPSPNQPKSTRAQNKPTSASPPIEFEELKASYPKRSGDLGWPKAIKACNARLAEGYSWDEMLAGAHRYHAYCKATGKIGTEYVKQAGTFFGPDKHFLSEWGAPSNKAEILRDQNIDASLLWLAQQEQADAN